MYQPVHSYNSLLYRDIVLSAFHRRSHSVTLESLSKYNIFAFRNGLPLGASLDDPAVNYQASVVRLRPKDDYSDESSDFYSCGSVCLCMSNTKGLLHFYSLILHQLTLLKAVCSSLMNMV